MIISILNQAQKPSHVAFCILILFRNALNTSMQNVKETFSRTTFDFLFNFLVRIFIYIKMTTTKIIGDFFVLKIDHCQINGRF